MKLFIRFLRDNWASALIILGIIAIAWVVLSALIGGAVSRQKVWEAKHRTCILQAMYRGSSACSARNYCAFKENDNMPMQCND